jgi:hypothetical protein
MVRTLASRRACALLPLAVVLNLAGPARAEMPLESTPCWQSIPSDHWDSGGAWGDIDGDGWLDMVVAGGNDIAQRHIVIFHNQGDGTLPLAPTWSSTQSEYHGHVDIGDIDGDRLPDVAVAVLLGPGGYGDPGWVKVHLNDGAGAFSATPDWVSSDRFYVFGVALADADGDGDLDLACACGDDYENHPERQRIYYNQDGTLESLPSWQSDELGISYDVHWGDVEGDGDLDLAFCGSSTPMRVYRNDQTAGGGIVTAASWENADLPQCGIATAFGDWDGDGFPELAVADNYNFCPGGRFKVYASDQGLLASVPAWSSADDGWGSHVSWIDLDLDGDLDLATGRWYGACRIYENTGGSLGEQPIWSSATSSVVENMFWGDVDNDGLRSDGLSAASGDGMRTHYPLGQGPVREVDEVRVDGVVLPPSAYAVHRAGGWVSIAPPPPPGTSNVEIRYTYSTDLDLGVTNWDDGSGNYLFRNVSVAAVPELDEAMIAVRVVPNPMIHRTGIRYRGAGVDHARLSITAVSGRRVRVLHDGPIPAGLVTWEWDRRNQRGRRVAAGVYFMQLTAGELSVTRRIVVLP